MKRPHLVIVPLFVVVLSCLAVLILSSHEPRYQGRTLSAWIEDARPGFYSYRLRQTNLVWQDSRRVVKQMAPDAIPFLLKWVQAKDSPLKTKLRLWLAQHPFLHLRITDDDQRHKQAMIGFWLLEDEGKPAWPVLIQWTGAADPERRFWAFDCLIESQADKNTILPVLSRLSRDPDTLIHDYAARQFRRRYPLEAAAAGVSNPPPNLQMFSSSLNIRTVRPVTTQSPAK